MTRRIFLLVSFSVCLMGCAITPPKAMINAAGRGDAATVQAFLSQGIDVNAKDKEGKTALMVASYYGHRDMVIMLLNEGANVNAKDQAGRTALIWASEDIGEQALVDKREIIQALLGRGADINAQGNDGLTALILISSWSDRETIGILLDHGAHINARDNDGHTALDQAFFNFGHRDIVDLLVHAGAKP